MTLEDFVKAQGISMDDFEEQSGQYAEFKVKQNLIVQGIMDAENMTLEDKKSLSIQDELIKAYSVKDLAALVDKPWMNPSDFSEWKILSWTMQRLRRRFLPVIPRE